MVVESGDASITVLEEIPNVNAVKLADPDFVQTANSLGITL